MMKPRHLITRKSRHVKIASITAKQYLRDQIVKYDKTDFIDDIIKTARSKAGPTSYIPDIIKNSQYLS